MYDVVSRLRDPGLSTDRSVHPVLWKQGSILQKISQLAFFFPHTFKLKKKKNAFFSFFKDYCWLAVITKYWLHIVVVHYILESVLHPVVCASPSPTLMVPAPSCHPTGNLCICESSSFWPYSLVCCISQIPHISDIIGYVSFSVRLTSLSLIPFRSILAAINGKISFFFNG